MSRRGFTLIEVLVCMVLIAILTAIASTASMGKAQAAMAVMKNDLRNIATAQESYFFVHQTYANNVNDLNLSASANISMQVNGGVAGWAARTEHTLRDNWACAMFSGTGVDILSPATEEGILTCQPKGTGGSGCGGG